MKKALLILFISSTRTMKLTCDEAVKILNDKSAKTGKDVESYSCADLPSLGSGATGQAYKIATDKNRDYVAKVVCPEDGEQDPDYDRIQREIHLLSKVNHKNVIKQQSHTWDKESSCFVQVLEFADHGTLASFISAKKDRFEGENIKFALKIVKNILDGLIAMYRENFFWPPNKPINPRHSYCHTDLKTQNVVIHKEGKTGTDNDFIAKIIDFDMIEPRGVASQKDWHGTSFYRDPESFKTPIVYDEFVDVYTIGIILYQMVHQGAIPWREREKYLLESEIDQGVFKIQSGVHWLAALIIMACAKHDKTHRPNVQRLSEFVGSFLAPETQILGFTTTGIEVHTKEKSIERQHLFLSKEDEKKIPNYEIVKGAFKVIPDKPAPTKRKLELEDSDLADPIISKQGLKKAVEKLNNYEILRKMKRQLGGATTLKRMAAKMVDPVAWTHAINPVADIKKIV